MARPNKDTQYLSELRDFFARHRVLPSYAELQQLIGFGSRNAAFKLGARLRDAGFVVTGPGGRLAPGKRFFELPWLSNQVPAGVGDPASASDGVDFQEIDRLLIDSPSETLLISIRGDSMQEAGVLDGDVAVVKRGATAASGDFVVALVDDQYTLKELRYEKNSPVLVPHNRAFKTIRPRADLSVLGVVTGIVRRYPSARSRIAARI